MKQKTIEEKRAAVLAYCERVMPNRDFPAVMDWGHIMFGYITFEEKDYEAYFLYISASINPIALYALSSDQTWIAAYRLFGLETFDAVKDLEARNAALVAALEEIAAEKSALDADDRQISIDTLSVHWSAVHRIASEARTEAEKEECAEIIRQAWDGIPVGFDVPAPSPFDGGTGK